jgi:protein TonB
METKKSQAAKLENKRGSLFAIGLVAALGLTLSAFEFTSLEKQSKKHIAQLNEEPENTEVIFEQKEQEAPKVKPEENFIPPKPQPPSNINPVVSTDIKTTTQATNPTTTLLPGETGNPNMTFTISPPIDEPVIEEFVIVENMPHFAKVSNINDNKLREAEQDKLLRSFIFSKIKYPEDAKSEGVQGTVYVTYLINKEGKVTNVEILKSVHPSLDREAKRVVWLIPDMVPGKQRGNPVNVRYVFPVKFILNK